MRREPVEPDLYIDVTTVMQRKRRLLACHRSQKEWLDVSQGMDAYLTTMEEFASEMGRRSGRVQAAEGWRRHNPYGFGGMTFDPMSTTLEGMTYGPAA